MTRCTPAGRPPYLDDDVPTPVHSYGAAKAAAETAVRVVDPGAVLVRTSLILGEGSKQIQLCRDALAGRATLFTDELRCPVDVGDLADAVLELADSAVAGPLNVAGPEPVSRAGLGLLVARRHGIDPAGMTTTTTTAAGLRRPTDVRLDSSRADRPAADPTAGCDRAARRLTIKAVGVGRAEMDAEPESTPLLHRSYAQILCIASVHSYCACMENDDTGGRPATSSVRIDHRQIRVLAHPLRMRLLGALRVQGPATATTLAELLDTNTGATSYHLRQLAEVGLVVEDPDRGTGRQRWWRAAHDVTSWEPTDFDDDPDARAAIEWIHGRPGAPARRAGRTLVRRPARLVTGLAGRVRDERHLPHLPADRLQALEAELWQVMERYRTEADPDEPDAERVHVFVAAFPMIEQR